MILTKENSVTYRYFKNWLHHEEKYNYLTHIETVILKDDDIIWPVSMFCNKISLIASGGYICPLFFYSGHKSYIPVKNLKRYFELYQNQLKKWSFNGKIQITFHQDPMTTFRFGYPILNSLYGLDNPVIKMFSRNRAWVSLKDQTMKSIRDSYRSSYRNILKKYSDNIKFYFGSLESDTLSDTLKRFQDKHFKLAGKTTKSQECWDILGQMVLSKESVLIELDNSFVYFLLSSDLKYAYYGINAADKNNNISHRLIDSGIEWLLKNNFDCLDLGNFYWDIPSEENIADTIRDQEFFDPKKLYDIGFFKLGFANKITPDYYYEITFNLDQ